MSYDEIQRNKARRLAKLKERQALEGIDTPPAVTLEIDELEAAGVRAEGHGSAAMFALPGWFPMFIVVSASGTSAALIIGVLDFILILALRGH